jgi:hypothetical protein
MRTEAKNSAELWPLQLSRHVLSGPGFRRHSSSRQKLRPSNNPWPTDKLVFQHTDYSPPCACSGSPPLGYRDVSTLPTQPSVPTKNIPRASSSSVL